MLNGAVDKRVPSVIFEMLSIPQGMLGEGGLVMQVAGGRHSTVRAPRSYGLFQVVRTCGTGDGKPLQRFLAER